MGLVWIVLGACLAVAALVVVVSLLLWRQRAALRDSEVGRLARRAAALPLRGKARLLWRLVGDRRVPLPARLLLPAVVLYLAMPFDIVPDFIPVVGYLDDVLVILGAAWIFVRLVPVPVLEEQVAAAEGPGPGRTSTDGSPPA